MMPAPMMTTSERAESEEVGGERRISLISYANGLLCTGVDGALIATFGPPLGEYRRLSVLICRDLCSGFRYQVRRR
jgi:hypothetical protein